MRLHLNQLGKFAAAAGCAALLLALASCEKQEAMADKRVKAKLGESGAIARGIEKTVAEPQREEQAYLRLKAATEELAPPPPPPRSTPRPPSPRPTMPGAIRSSRPSTATRPRRRWRFTKSSTSPPAFPRNCRRSPPSRAAIPTPTMRTRPGRPTSRTRTPTSASPAPRRRKWMT